MAYPYLGYPLCRPPPPPRIGSEKPSPGFVPSLSCLQVPLTRPPRELTICANDAAAMERWRRGMWGCRSCCVPYCPCPCPFPPAEPLRPALPPRNFDPPKKKKPPCPRSCSPPCPSCASPPCPCPPPSEASPNSPEDPRPPTAEEFLCRDCPEAPDCIICRPASPCCRCNRPLSCCQCSFRYSGPSTTTGTFGSGSCRYSNGDHFNKDNDREKCCPCRDGVKRKSSKPPKVHRASRRSIGTKPWPITCSTQTEYNSQNSRCAQTDYRLSSMNPRYNMPAGMPGSMPASICFQYPCISPMPMMNSGMCVPGCTGVFGYNPAVFPSKSERSFNKRSSEEYLVNSVDYSDNPDLYEIKPSMRRTYDERDNGRDNELTVYRSDVGRKNKERYNNTHKGTLNSLDALNSEKKKSSSYYGSLKNTRYRDGTRSRVSSVYHSQTQPEYHSRLESGYNSRSPTEFQPWPEEEYDDYETDEGVCKCPHCQSKSNRDKSVCGKCKKRISSGGSYGGRRRTSGRSSYGPCCDCCPRIKSNIAAPPPPLCRTRAGKSPCPPAKPHSSKSPRPSPPSVYPSGTQTSSPPIVCPSGTQTSSPPIVYPSGTQTSTPGSPPIPTPGTPHSYSPHPCPSHTPRTLTPRPSHPCVCTSSQPYVAPPCHPHPMQPCPSKPKQYMPQQPQQTYTPQPCTPQQSMPQLSPPHPSTPHSSPSYPSPPHLSPPHISSSSHLSPPHVSPPHVSPPHLSPPHLSPPHPSPPRQSPPQPFSHQPSPPQPCTPKPCTPQHRPPQPCQPQPCPPQPCQPQPCPPQPCQPQPCPPQPYPPQPYPPQPYPPQPYPPQPCTPQPYQPHPSPPQSYTPQSCTPKRSVHQTRSPPKCKTPKTPCLRVQYTSTTDMPCASPLKCDAYQQKSCEKMRKSGEKPPFRCGFSPLKGTCRNRRRICQYRSSGGEGVKCRFRQLSRRRFRPQSTGSICSRNSANQKVCGQRNRCKRGQMQNSGNNEPFAWASPVPGCRNYVPDTCKKYRNGRSKLIYWQAPVEVYTASELGSVDGKSFEEYDEEEEDDGDGDGEEVCDEEEEEEEEDVCGVECDEECHSGFEENEKEYDDDDVESYNDDDDEGEEILTSTFFDEDSDEEDDGGYSYASSISGISGIEVRCARTSRRKSIAGSSAPPICPTAGVGRLRRWTTFTSAYKRNDRSRRPRRCVNRSVVFSEGNRRRRGDSLEHEDSDWMDDRKRGKHRHRKKRSHHRNRYRMVPMQPMMPPVDDIMSAEEAPITNWTDLARVAPWLCPFPQFAPTLSPIPQFMMPAPLPGNSSNPENTCPMTFMNLSDMASTAAATAVAVATQQQQQQQLQQQQPRSTISPGTEQSEESTKAQKKKKVRPVRVVKPDVFRRARKRNSPLSSARWFSPGPSSCSRSIRSRNSSQRSPVLKKGSPKAKPPWRSAISPVKRTSTSPTRQDSPCEAHKNNRRLLKSDEEMNTIFEENHVRRKTTEEEVEDELEATRAEVLPRILNLARRLAKKHRATEANRQGNSLIDTRHRCAVCGMDCGTTHHCNLSAEQNNMHSSPLRQKRQLSSRREDNKEKKTSYI